MKPFLALFAALVLSACATTARIDASGDVHQLMVAIRDGDQAGFERHVDRDALKSQVRARLISEAGRNNSPWAALGVVAARPVIDAAADALIQPDVFRAVAELYGYRAGQPLPGRAVIASNLNYLPDGQVCVTDRGRCQLMFRNEGGTWRLSGFEGDLNVLRRR